MAATAAELQPQPAPQADDKRLATSHLRVRKTQARPQRTLFGSVLERFGDAEARQQLPAAACGGGGEAAEAAHLRERPNPAAQLPAELRDYVRRRHEPGIRSSSHQVDEYRRRLQVRDRRLNLMERDAKYVFELPHPVESLPPPPGRDYGPRPRWMTAGDVSHSAEVNPHFMGPGVRNFNRDKYRQLAASHSYALVGDPLRRGMEFDRAPVELPLQPPPLPMHSRPDRLVLTPRTQQRRQATRRLPPSSQLINGVQVPMRLKHQFGSEVCEDLLADRDAVLDTSRRIQQRDRASSLRRTSAQSKPAAAAGEGNQREAMPDAGDPSYEQLGNALRTNVFGRGYSTGQRVSSNHVDFSTAQFDRRELVPSQYRYQKDHVSRWAEANVLEMRMKKALQERMDRMLHKKTDD